MNHYYKLNVNHIFRLYNALLTSIYKKNLSRLMFIETSLLEKAAAKKGFALSHSRSNHSLVLSLHKHGNSSYMLLRTPIS